MRVLVKHSLTSPQDIAFNVISTAAFVVVLYFQRDATAPGSAVPLAMLTLPGILGLGVAFNGLIGVISMMAVEREDGTLLRVKAVPQGMLGCLVGRIALLMLQSSAGLAIMVVAGVVLVLLAWAVASLLIAPPILRRMARRESGPLMEARRHRALQRVV
ncbi:hypothetical protein [Nonomuraea polychroma]|uniref:hypothetical protein n=1 Tax=Nonomuraea polychroma TaxID=46176 RepID=UPI0019D4DDDE|nr:hypothetical protein [Nonomuraea polychroma]